MAGCRYNRGHQYNDGLPPFHNHSNVQGQWLAWWISFTKPRRFTWACRSHSRQPCGSPSCSQLGDSRTELLLARHPYMRQSQLFSVGRQPNRRCSWQPCTAVQLFAAERLRPRKREACVSMHGTYECKFIRCGGTGVFVLWTCCTACAHAFMVFEQILCRPAHRLVHHHRSWYMPQARLACGDASHDLPRRCHWWHTTLMQVHLCEAWCHLPVEEARCVSTDPHYIAWPKYIRSCVWNAQLIDLGLNIVVVYVFIVARPHWNDQ